MGAVRITKSSLAPTLKIGLVSRFQFEHTLTWPANQPTLAFERNKRYEAAVAVGVSGEFHRVGLELRYFIADALYWSQLGESPMPDS